MAAKLGPGWSDAVDSEYERPNDSSRPSDSYQGEGGFLTLSR